jgi:hypothetical protein
VEQGMKLKDQEVLYAYLEGRHCADDDERDNGRFYMKMALDLPKRDMKLWHMFTTGYHERLLQNEQR